jgi:hypothetical protein
VIGGEDHRLIDRAFGADYAHAHREPQQPTQ